MVCVACISAVVNFSISFFFKLIYKVIGLILTKAAFIWLKNQ